MFDFEGEIFKMAGGAPALQTFTCEYPRAGFRHRSSKCARTCLHLARRHAREFCGKQASRENSSPRTAFRSRKQCRLCCVRSSAVDEESEPVLRQFDIVSADTHSPID